MTKEREVLELISEYVQARAQSEAGVEPVGRTLDEIAEAFGQIIRGQDVANHSDRIPPIMTREDEMHSNPTAEGIESDLRFP